MKIEIFDPFEFSLIPGEFWNLPQSSECGEPVFSAPLIKETVFSPEYVFGLFIKDHRCVLTVIASDSSALLYLSMHLFLCRHDTVFITAAL